LLIAAVTSISACSFTPEQRQATTIGAIGGGLTGGGIGCAIGLETDEDDPKAVGLGCGIGVITGALVGGTIGYLAAPHAPPPAPPPPPPRPLPPPPPPPPPPVRQKLVLRGVHFDFNKSNIRPGDAAVLDEAAATLKSNPNVTIDVNGYCDAIGSVEYNLKLSDRRADAVEDYLEKAGIPESRLIPHGYGKTNFVATNDTSEGRAQNRRVELVPQN
jgi:OOP family OmpA-OmpF porin